MAQGATAEGGDAVVLDPQRWLELRRFRALVESGAVSLTEVAKETGLDRGKGQVPAALLSDPTARIARCAR